jgi:hypothetical protein
MLRKIFFSCSCIADKGAARVSATGVVLRQYADEIGPTAVRCDLNDVKLYLRYDATTMTNKLRCQSGRKIRRLLGKRFMYGNSDLRSTYILLYLLSVRSDHILYVRSST